MSASTSPSRLLVVDDEPDLRTLYELTLLREGYDVETAASVDDARLALQDHAFDAIITDMRLPDGTGIDLLRHLESIGRREKAIVITAYGSAENAVEALKAGAFDYLTKPVDLKQFRAVVAAALSSKDAVAPALRELSQGRPGALARKTDSDAAPPSTQGAPAAPPALPVANAALARLTGRSRAIEHVRQLIEKVSRSMAPVLLWGESGTGKELVARAIHDVGTRHGQPFVAVNCGAIPEQLLEAEFFGYRKGAFTGAQEDREGFFQAARGGTLFLDEIGDLPLPMQSKLLRAIQERAVRPVGAISEIPVDVRILSATHKDLAREVQAARFRQDLFYRLNVIQIPLPALRDRLEDLPLICDQVLRRITHETGQATVPQLAPAAEEALRRYNFPGNVRELENILHRAVALSTDHQIGADDLGLHGHLAPAPEPCTSEPALAPPTPQAPLPAGPVSTPPTAPTTRSNTDSAHADLCTPLPTDLAAHLDQIERDILVRALEKCRLNRTAAGASLGLSLRQMRYRMARLGVQVTPQGVELGERFDPGDTEHDPLT
jgi:two-component system response regulator PilR (NtrC family)